MKRLFTTVLTTEDADGNSVSKHVFQVQGEDKFSANTVTFKVYDVQNKLIKRDPADPNKVIAESVFFDAVRKGVAIPDSTGGNACGRSFPSWEGRVFTPEERQVNSKIATYYTFLIGEVTFPGSEPQLVNFRMPASIVMAWYKFQDSIGKDPSLWPSYLLELKAKPQKAKPQFTEVLFSIKDKGLTLEDTQPILDEVNTFVQEHNNNILKQVA